MHDVLTGLDPEQRLVAEALSGPVLVVAGAGTGKTRAITHRIAHACLTGSHDAATGLAVTFTTRAAGEMRHRLAHLGVPGVAVRTFHAAALSQVRHFWPAAVGGAFPELVTSKTALVGQAARSLGLPAPATLVRDLSAEIEWAASSLIGVAQYPEQALAAGRPGVGSGPDALGPPDVARVMAAYQEAKMRAGSLDFEDVLLALVAILGQRPDIADEVRRRYRWFTVDEYQDVTPVQEALLDAWLGERDDVCVVGDPSQTIYSFAGATADSLARFTTRWPQATRIRLDRCYRSTPEVVQVANALIAAGHRSGGGPSQPAPVMLRSQRPTGPAVDIVTCADDADEAATVVSRIQDLVRGGTAPRDIAVLMRTNAASAPIEGALADAGVAYVLRGGERFFERPEVREAVVRMRGQATADQRRRDPQLRSLGEQLAPVLDGMGWTPEGPLGAGPSRDRWESLAALVALADDLAGQGVADLSGLVAEVERRAAISHAPSADGITLATLHAAKGLEWPAVFVVGCAEGTIPIVHADTPARVAEERRLLYVGLTRARDRLVVTWALARPGSGRYREPSRFLAELRSGGAMPWAAGHSGPVGAPGRSSGLISQGRSTAAAERRRQPPARCRVCGAALVTAREGTVGRCRTCPGSADPVLVERLREWRTSTAQARGVPAFVVLTDATVDALAERRPTDAEALLGVPGVGRAKLAQYGEELLALLRP